MLPLFSFNQQSAIFRQSIVLSAEPVNVSAYGGAKNVKFILKTSQIDYSNLQGALGEFFIGYSAFYDSGTLIPSLDLKSPQCAKLISRQTAVTGRQYGSLGMFMMPLHASDSLEGLRTPLSISVRPYGFEGMSKLPGGLAGDVEIYLSSHEDVPFTVKNDFDHGGCILEITILQQRIRA